MAGIKQKSCGCESVETHKENLKSLNLLRSHVSIMTAVTAITSLITNIQIAIIIAVTKNDYQ